MQSYRVKAKAVKGIARGRPRIEMDNFPSGTRLPPPGIWIRLTDPEDRFLALGLSDRDRNAFCRIFHQEGAAEGPPGEAFYRERLQDALRLRERLFRGAATDVYRLVNGEGDGIPGIVMDRYGGFAVSWEHTPGLHAIGPLVYPAAKEIFGLQGIYVKGSPRRGFHPGRAAEDRPALGAAAPGSLYVSEGNLRLEARLREGARTGVYPDQRENRLLLSACVKGRRVLNTFSYTGAFSVAAALAGAEETVSVDLSRRSLDWSMRNFRLNGIDPAGHRHVKADVFDYLKLARKKGLSFGVIVLDPVTFSTSKSGVFQVKRDWPRLLAGSLAVLEKDGCLALSCNTWTLSEKELLRFLEEACSRAGRPLEIEEARGLPPDFPVHPQLPRMMYLKFILARCG